jgi:limonene-1,2-epoxide hydrolase
MNTENERVVRDFCDAWSRRNVEEILGYFADDAVYHNIPLDAVRGRDGIRQVLATFVPPSEKIEFEMLHIASAGPIVFTERVDRFVMRGRDVSLPVAGVFEIRDGKIAAWRDYFDMQTWLKQNS